MFSNVPAFISPTIDITINEPGTGTSLLLHPSISIMQERIGPPIFIPRATAEVINPLPSGQDVPNYLYRN